MKKNYLLSLKTILFFVVLFCWSLQGVASTFRAEFANSMRIRETGLIASLENNISIKKHLVIRKNDSLKHIKSFSICSESEFVILKEAISDSSNEIIVDNPYYKISLIETLCNEKDVLLFSFKNKMPQKIIMTIVYDGIGKEIYLSSNEEKSSSCENISYSLDVSLKNFKRELFNVVKIQSE